MNDEEAFERALQERPDDMALRQVYADWLEERGDPGCEIVRQEVSLPKAAQPPSVPPTPILTRHDRLSPFRRTDMPSRKRGKTDSVCRPADRWRRHMDQV
jgi:uncharacterized protein (TIGR02996 family)